MEEIYSENVHDKSRSATRQVPTQTYATVSVGLCATVETENTLSLAQRILKIDDPAFRVKEVIVATPNRTLALRLERDDGRLIILFENKREGKASALNKIIGRATGDILVIASAEITIGDDSIQKLVKGLIYNDDWGIADARVLMTDGDRSLMDKVNGFLWRLHNATLDELDREERLAHAGDMFAVRRKLVDPISNVTNDDAHIALEVRKRGFKVKRVPKANVWIRGPSSPTDYILQRSRILRGHMELIRKFKTTPTTFEFSSSSRPIRNTRLLLRTLNKLGLSYVPALVTACVLEIFSFQIAILGAISKSRKEPWKLALTTKSR